MKDTIKFLKTRKVKSPSRANQFDAGIDFYVPEFTEEFLKDLREKNPDIQIFDMCIRLMSGERVLIPSGIHCQMASPGRALVAANKSGVATKNGLIYGAQVVDYEYQGEIHLSLINTNGVNQPSHAPMFVDITPGMKILQFLEMPIYNSDVEVSENMSIDEFYTDQTTRGAGGFGSTDHK